MSSVALYISTQPGAQEDLVARHAPLVKRIAYHLISRLPPSVQADDLIQAGMIGLLEAAKHYDARRGAGFETYAGIRIRGAMLDEVRKSDWTPRSVHRKAREVAEAVREIENTLGHDARDHEIAEFMGMTLHDYHRFLQDATTCHIFSFEDMRKHEDDELPIADEGPNPFEQLQSVNFQQHVAGLVDDLPERERLVIALYYGEDLNLREIGEVLGVSESRVSQIHGQALLRLRARLLDREQRRNEARGHGKTQD
jgi:RNA polymerase sigma factor for flagellar operon FliA